MAELDRLYPDEPKHDGLINLTKDDFRKQPFEVPTIELDPNKERDMHYRVMQHNKVPAKLDNDGPEVEDFTDAEKESLLYETNFILNKFHKVFVPDLKYTNHQFNAKKPDIKDICYCCQNLYLFKYTVNYHVYKKPDDDKEYRICQ